MDTNSLLHKVKKSFAFLFFFIPTSLFLLILLTFNGVTIFCFPLPKDFSSLAETATKSSSSSFIYNAVKEEIQAPKLKAHQKLHLLKELSFPRLLPINTTSSSLAHKPPKLLRKKRSMFKILLEPKSESRRFHSRAKDFFDGGSSSFSCEIRFFMTWITSLESFGYRELFTVESLFKSHPNACLLIISNSMDSKQGERLLRPFSTMGFRVCAISPDYPYLFKNTFAESWFDRLKRGNVNPGEVSLGQNLSNLIRLAALYKFGGVYIDTDVIVMKSFANLRNVIGAQTIDVESGEWSRLNNAVMVFEKNHPLLYKFIEEFALTFDGNKWGHNGPYLVSRVASRVVNRRQPGFNFTVLPPDAFYPVNWSRIRSLFRGPKDREHSRWVLAKLKHIRKESFAIHLWNRQSRRLKVEDGSIIHRIMSDCCVFCNSTTSNAL